MRKTNLFNVGMLAALALLAGVNQGAAQSTAFTYQGRLSQNGTNFTGAGQFKFALQVSTNTSSQPIVGVGELSGINSGSIITCVVYYGGNGYVTPPAVTFSGGNPDATGTAVLSNGVVTGINIISGGYYPAEAFVSVAPPPASYTNFTIWNNDGTSGGEPVSAVSVGVTNGLFTVPVGNPALPNMTAIPESIFLETNLLLQIWFNDGVAGWAALNPAQALTATPYASFANAAGTLTGTLPTSQLSGTVPTSQLSGSVPASSLTGSVPVASLTSVPAASLTGRLPLTAFPTNLAVAGAMNLDVISTYGINPGTVRSNALTFGTGPAGSGEGIASKRVGTNPFDLEFYTGFINRMTILSSGYVGIGTTNPVYEFQVNNGSLITMTLDGSGNLECAGTVYSKGQALTSDRNLKENFQPVDNQAVLAKVAALPVTEWNYKSDSQSIHHMGPMAQDFQAAFGLDGRDDKHISVVDEGGVALAAIQGLNAKVEEKDAEIQALEKKLAALQAEVEQMVGKR